MGKHCWCGQVLAPFLTSAEGGVFIAESTTPLDPAAIFAADVWDAVHYQQGAQTPEHDVQTASGRLVLAGLCRGADAAGAVLARPYSGGLT